MRGTILLLTMGLLIASCGNSTEETKTTAKQEPSKPKGPVESKLNQEGTQKLMGMVQTYYELKNALVATKAADANKAAAKLAQTADELQAYLAKDSANGPALKPYMDTISQQTKAIAGIQDESCEKQRIPFSTLSGAMYNMIKSAAMKNAGIYHEYCPMAFNDKGAYWLSSESEIKNPYFGKKMLECGEVTDSL